jgi:hypothetical protein
MNTNTRGFTAFALACLALAACTPAEQRAERPQTVTTPGLDTGITSNNGGGQKALGNNVGVGVTTPDSRAR